MIIPNNDYNQNINHKALKIHKPSKIPPKILKALEESTPIFKDFPNASVKYKQKKVFNIQSYLWRNRFYRYFNTTITNFAEFNLGEKNRGKFNIIQFRTSQDTGTSLRSDFGNLYYSIRALFKKYPKDKFDMNELTPEKISSKLKYYQNVYEEKIAKQG